MGNADPIKKPWGELGHSRKLLRHPPCYSYMTVKSDKSIGSDRGKKTYTSKVKDPLSFEIYILVAVNQIAMTTVESL